MRDVLIESWDALHSAVFENVWDPAIMRYRNNRVYRGMSDGPVSYTHLSRLCSGRWIEKYTSPSR